jgi:hypothetical protein
MVAGHCQGEAGEDPPRGREGLEEDTQVQAPKGRETQSAITNSNALRCC